MYKFKSRATGDLIMLEPNGRQILKILGKDDDPSLLKGILIPADMAAAIAALEAAVAQDETRVEGDTPPRPGVISLRQRATPLIAMIRRCQQANVDIVWGV
jgi:hypothetical protein